MPMTPGTMGTTPYVITHRPVTTLATVGNHHRHDPADRKDQNEAGIGANLTRVTFTDNAAGATYYLPFSANNVHSMHLPANPGFGATFTTANLDGCWIFVECKIGGSVIVYHANASGPGVAPTAQQSATQPLFQTPAATAQLMADFTAARAHYPVPATAQTYILRKSRYLQAVDAELARKTAQNRTGINFPGPEHGSYTTFAGFYVGGHWEFWFQTFSQFIYRRPAANARFWRGRNVNPDVVNDNYRIMEATRWLLV